MKPTTLSLTLAVATLLGTCPTHAAEHFVSLTGGHVPPFTSWADAATNIQAAVDAASAGETVWVTNGVYATGGKVMSGDLTNRVALNKALTLQSVNGAAVTMIDGASTTNGPAAVRCVWMTNEAVLSGFTIYRGGTRYVAGSSIPEGRGGGVWGSSSNAIVMNCVLATNVADFLGGGAYGVTLTNCLLLGNRHLGNDVPNLTGGGGAAGCVLLNCVLDGNASVRSTGGGARSSSLRNCALTRNSAWRSGGGAYGGTLINCTVSGNLSGQAFPTSEGGAVASAGVTNCIVMGNLSGSGMASANYLGGTLAYCDTTPLPAGPGNISLDPLLLSDGMHLSASSPCRGAGTNTVISGTDIDGQAWANPPSMGCDEWLPPAVIALQPTFSVGPGGGELTVQAQAAGLEPFHYSWFKDGSPLTNNAHYPTVSSNLVIREFGPADAGGYWVIASNLAGVATSRLAQLTVHCVDAANPSPAAPFLTWAAAARSIQDAVDAASAGEFVLVTNGIYATGGRATGGNLTNRVVVDKALSVFSVNGAQLTAIEGAWDPVTTNGPAAVRGVWLADGAVLAGFTVRNGATRTTGALDQDAGGISGSPSTRVLNCVVRRNCANQYGGGVAGATVLNSLICENISFLHGGGISGGRLVNSTVVSNYARVTAGGVYSASGTTNSIVYFNSSGAPNVANFFVSTPILYCCTTPLPSGVGNKSADPQLLDGYHLAVTSPCRGAGTNQASGVDLDGEPWANPPSMGCDEVWESALTGPLAVSASAAWPVVAAKGSLPLTGNVTGRATRVGWDFGDGTVLTNASLRYTSHIWTNPGNYTVTFTALNVDHPGGVSATVPVQVVPLAAPTLTTGGLNGTNFTLSFPGQPGVTYIVQQTTNLVPPVTWQTLTTLTSTGQVMQVFDSKATNATRFYRTQVP